MYDVIIVGAGPAGSSAAYHCAQKGLKTLLLDKKKVVGVPKQCGEGINEEILKELNLELKPEWIANSIDSMVIFNFKNTIKFGGKRNRGFILDRKKFDPGLVERARKSGAEVRLNCSVTDLTPDGVICGKEEIKGKIIVGADGPNTIIGQKSGLGKPRSGFGLQYELITKKTEFPNSLQFYFDSLSKYSGYFWIFPKKETLNIGVADLKIRNLRPALNCFIKRLNLEKEPLKEINAGLIPLYGPQEKFCNKQVLLVGDAAGHTNPLSGGGIPVAIFDGQLVSQVIIDHFQKNISLTSYQKLWWNSDFGKSTSASFKLRKCYIKYLGKDPFNLILNEVGTLEIATKKELFKLVLKLPLKYSLLLFWYGRQFLKYCRYAW